VFVIYLSTIKLQMFKEQQKEIVNKAEAFLRKSGLSDKNIHILLLGFHLFLIISTVCIVLFGSKLWFYLIVFLNISVFLLFFIFGGCILSKLENRFSDDFNIIDLLLLLLKIERNKKNRKKYTNLFFIFLSLCILIIYYIRFGMSKNRIIKSPYIKTSDII
jgi:hypothetical protein